AVYEVLELIATGNHHVLVPILRLDRRLKVARFAERSGNFDFGLAGLVRIFLDDHLLATLGEDAAPAFLVENAAVNLARLEIGLVAANDKVRELSAPILNSGIA